MTYFCCYECSSWGDCCDNCPMNVATTSDDYDGGYDLPEYDEDYGDEQYEY